MKIEENIMEPFSKVFTWLKNIIPIITLVSGVISYLTINYYKNSYDIRFLSGPYTFNSYIDIAVSIWVASFIFIVGLITPALIASRLPKKYTQSFLESVLKVKLGENRKNKFSKIRFLLNSIILLTPFLILFGLRYYLGFNWITCVFAMIISIPIFVLSFQIFEWKRKRIINHIGKILRKTIAVSLCLITLYIFSSVILIMYKFFFQKIGFRESIYGYHVPIIMVCFFFTLNMLFFEVLNKKTKVTKEVLESLLMSAAYLVYFSFFLNTSTFVEKVMYFAEIRYPNHTFKISRDNRHLMEGKFFNLELSNNTENFLTLKPVNVLFDIHREESYVYFHLTSEKATSSNIYRIKRKYLE